MDAIINELKGLVSIVENLENFANIYPLDSDQRIELEQSRNRINQLIKSYNVLTTIQPNTAQ
jgi:hypothetical protein